MARGRPARLVAATALLAGLTPTLDAANHREAPIRALDHKADITDVYRGGSGRRDRGAHVLGAVALHVQHVGGRRVGARSTPGNDG